MFSRFRSKNYIIAVAALILAGCGGKNSRPVERLAVLPAENLSGDASLDWVGYSLAAIVVEDLTGAASLNAKQANSTRAAAAFRANRILHGYYDVHDSRVLLRVVMEDLDTNRVTKEFQAEASIPDGILGMAGRVTVEVASAVRSFSTQEPEAIQAYGEAMAAVDGFPERENALRRALVADAGFVEAATALGQLLLSQGRNGEAEGVLREALQSDRIDETGKRRIDFLLSSAGGTPAVLAEAVADYARMLPADTDAMEQAAMTALRARLYREAAEWYQRAALLEPDRPDLWNSRAYPLAYAGDLDGAIESLGRYQQGVPEDANVYDSFGEVYYRFGNYETAAAYFLQAFGKNPEFQRGIALVKAARCYLMQGDVEKADQIFQQYVKFREEVSDPLISFRAASWQYQSGRRKEAVASLTAILEQDDLQPAWVPGMRSQLAMWALLAGNREEAVRQADLALGATSGRVADGALIAVKFLSEPPAGPEEWRARAERMFTGDAQNRLMQELLLYAHLLSGHFEEALPLAESLYREAAPFAEGELQVLLAWALLKTGEIERAGELLRPNPVIQPETESPAYSLVFPRILYLRGLVADHAGEREEAVRNMELFLSYSGDLPGTFGEEENARTVVTADRR